MRQLKDVSIIGGIREVNEKAMDFSVDGNVD